MNDLFPSLPKTLSPRLAWMQRNNIKTAPQDEDEDGNTWFAVSCCADEDPYQMAMAGRLTRAAETEDEALTELAKAAGIPLWNEEAV
jgi:hypothetical protein